MDPEKSACHTIKSRCACVWTYLAVCIWWLLDKWFLILLFSLKTYLSSGTLERCCKNTWAIFFFFFLSLSSFFSAGHLSIFPYFFLYLFLHSHMLLLQQIIWEIITRTGALIGWKPNNDIFGLLSPSVGVQQFWDVSKWKACFLCTSSVEAAYIWWCVRESWF